MDVWVQEETNHVVRAGDGIEVLMRAGMGTKLSSSAGLNSLEQFQLLPAKYAERSGESAERGDKEQLLPPFERFEGN